MSTTLSIGRVEYYHAAMEVESVVGNTILEVNNLLVKISYCVELEPDSNGVAAADISIDINFKTATMCTYRGPEPGVQNGGTRRHYKTRGGVAMATPIVSGRYWYQCAACLQWQQVILKAILSKQVYTLSECWNRKKRSKPDNGTENPFQVLFSSDHIRPFSNYSRKPPT